MRRSHIHMFLWSPAILSGCHREDSSTSSDTMSNQRKKLSRMGQSASGQTDWVFNTSIADMKQPAFTPLIDREGGIITFDVPGDAVHGMTVRVYDPKIRKEVSIREFTKEELDEASRPLREHFLKFIGRDIQTAVVHCHNLWRAAEEALGNTKAEVNYWMEADIRTGLCRLFRQ